MCVSLKSSATGYNAINQNIDTFYMDIIAFLKPYRIVS